MHRLILLSDLHVGKANNAHYFSLLVQWIMDNCTQGQDVVAITGDLVETPTEASFKETAQSILKLRDAGFDVLCVPGNHDLHLVGLDLGSGFNFGRDMWEAHIDPVCSWQDDATSPKRFLAGDVTIIGVDTNKSNSNDWKADIAAGVVGEAQQLDLVMAVQDQPCVVLGHHRLFWSDLLHRLADRDDVFKILKGQAWGWICGHRHKQERIEKGNFVSIASRRSTQLENGHLFVTIIDLVEGLPSEVVDAGQVTQ